jgi:hypothetical protein
LLLSNSEIALALGEAGLASHSTAAHKRVLLIPPQPTYLQIAACADVRYVNATDVPAEVLAKEKAIEMEKEDLKSKPEAIRCVLLPCAARACSVTWIPAGVSCCISAVYTGWLHWLGLLSLLHCPLLVHFPSLYMTAINACGCSPP